MKATWSQCANDISHLVSGSSLLNQQQFGGCPNHFTSLKKYSTNTLSAGSWISIIVGGNIVHILSKLYRILKKSIFFTSHIIIVLVTTCSAIQNADLLARMKMLIDSSSRNKKSGLNTVLLLGTPPSSWTILTICGNSLKRNTPGTQFVLFELKLHLRWILYELKSVLDLIGAVSIWIFRGAGLRCLDGSSFSLTWLSNHDASLEWLVGLMSLGLFCLASMFWWVVLVRAPGLWLLALPFK